MLSVVIPARNAAAVLPGQLAALAAQSFDGAWEVVVADNGSTDATAEVARTAGLANLRVVAAHDRRGINHARNIGGRAAAGDVLLFCDTDDLVADGWLEAMAGAAARGCDAFGGALDRRRLNDDRWLAPELHRATELHQWPGFLPFAPGANCGVRAALFRSLGGFDEEYAGGSDDVEFFWRLQLAGYEVCFVADAVVHYRERPRLRDVARQFYGYGVQDPHLYRDFRDHGVAGRGLSAGLRSWARLAVLSPWDLADPVRRRRWVKAAARRVGRVRGSVRYRTLYL